MFCLPSTRYLKHLYVLVWGIFYFIFSVESVLNQPQSLWSCLMAKQSHTWWICMILQAMSIFQMKLLQHFAYVMVLSFLWMPLKGYVHWMHREFKGVRDLVMPPMKSVMASLAVVRSYNFYFARSDLLSRYSFLFASSWQCNAIWWFRGVFYGWAFIWQHYVIPSELEEA